jgi:hypothetical protein
MQLAAAVALSGRPVAKRQVWMVPMTRLGSDGLHGPYGERHRGGATHRDLQRALGMRELRPPMSPRDARN